MQNGPVNPEPGASEPGGPEPAGSEPAGSEPTVDTAPPLPGMGAGGMFDSVMPIVIFLGLNWVAGLPWAIGGATLWSLKVAYSRKRQGIAVGKFLPIITIGIIARGVLGIVTDSEAVYFGIGIATKAAIGLGLIGSVLIGRNLIASYAPLLFGFDRATTAHPIYKRAMDRVAWIAGIAELISAAFDVWLFKNSSVAGYLTIRFFVNWPFNAAVIVIVLSYLSRQLDKIPGFPGMAELLDTRMMQYEAALKDRRGLRRFRPPPTP